jgi:GGDEF domain-containing protein
MQVGPPRRRRARPVADAPIETLLAGIEDLTKGWLLALLEQHELDEAPRILAADLTRDGPRVCDAVVRSIATDSDLRRLEPGGALEPLVSRTGVLAGAQTPEQVSRAVEALHGVVWTALRDELRTPDPDQVSEIVERLAAVMELVRGAALRRVAGADNTAAAGQFGRSHAASAGLALPTDRAESGRASVPQRAVGPRPLTGAPDRRPADGASAPTSAGQALWVGALQEEIQRSERFGTPLSLLLAELEDASRVVAVETPDDATTTFGRFARAVRGVARRQDILVCETEARAWIIARDTGRTGARALGSRIVGAVGEAGHWRGAPMAAAVGVVVLGEDGRTPSELVDAAQEAWFAATAGGSAVAAAQPAEPPEPPADPAPGPVR